MNNINDDSLNRIPITPRPTSITAFVGRAQTGIINYPVVVRSWDEYEVTFGGLWHESSMSYAVRQFFLNGGGTAVIVRVFKPRGAAEIEWRVKHDVVDNDETGERLDWLDYLDDDNSTHAALYALQHSDDWKILCVPPAGNVCEPKYFQPEFWDEVIDFARDKCAMVIVDPDPQEVGLIDYQVEDSWFDDIRDTNAIAYYPNLRILDPLRYYAPITLAPSGTVAGVIARTDTIRGVWKAPAGIDATLVNVNGFERSLNDSENALLNDRAINCLRRLPAAGHVVWGSRVLTGMSDNLSLMRYVPTLRTAHMIEDSIAYHVAHGTTWRTARPANGPELWKLLEVSVGAFMHDLYRKGAFQGRTPREAYYVRCDATTTPASHLQSGYVCIDVGFAALKPAEFFTINVICQVDPVTVEKEVTA